MSILFFLCGLIAGLFSVSNLIIALFFFIPLARKYAHAYRRATYINPVKRFLLGPIPYGTILLFPLFAMAFLFGVWAYVRSEWYEFSLFFSAGAITSGLFGFLSLGDKNGKHRRTFNLSWGDQYESDYFGDESTASLRDEQLYHDLPDLLKEARSRLLANDGKHDSSNQVKADLGLLSERYGIQPDQLLEEVMSNLEPGQKKGELPEWKRNLVLKEEAYVIPSALLRFTIRQEKSGKVVYCFSSTV